jgi:hypothetical protein
MTFGIPTGPVGHLSLAFALAFILKLDMRVTLICAILPDLVDKPLTAVMNITEGRYIAHTLLFVTAVSLAFFAWKRAYGLAAFVGGVSHLLLDLGGPLPLFYPFASYEFTRGRVDLGGHFWDYLVSGGLSMDLVLAAVLGLAVILYYALSNRWQRLDGRGGIKPPELQFALLMPFKRWGRALYRSVLKLALLPIVGLGAISARVNEK